MIVQGNEILNKILDYKYGRIKKGLPIGVEGIDNHYRYLQNNFVLCMGHANTGKTTFIIYLFVVWAMKHKLRFLLFSSENTPESIMRKIIEFKMGQTVDQASEMKISKAISWAESHFKLISNSRLYNYKDLLNEAKSIKEAWDYQCLLIDPYNSLKKEHTLVKAVGTHEYDYEVASEFRMFAKKQKVSVYLNVHANTQSIRQVHPRGHDYEGLATPLNGANIEGGSKWVSRSDDILSIHRYIAHPKEWMFTQLHVLKVKEIELNGRPTSHDKPLKFRMAIDNVGFVFEGLDILKDKQPKQIEI